MSKTKIKITHGKNLKIPLDPCFLEIVIGSLLGDGHARLFNGKTYLKFGIGGSNLSYGF